MNALENERNTEVSKGERKKTLKLQGRSGGKKLQRKASSRHITQRVRRNVTEKNKAPEGDRRGIEGERAKENAQSAWKKPLKKKGNETAPVRFSRSRSEG